MCNCFKTLQVKLAYEAILQHEAGYRPPPPGSAPNASYAEAYWHAHSADGRVPWGQFAGARLMHVLPDKIAGQNQSDLLGGDLAAS
jgi:hypothetical protein